MLFSLVLLGALQFPQGSSRASDSYLDSGASDLVARARARRERAERLVTAYQVTVTQRIGAGLRALRRDRLVFHQELVARIDWRRDGQSRIEVTGARQGIPVAARGDEVPDDVGEQVRWLVINPAEDYLRLMGDDADGFSYPIREGGEADYRYASGDTTTITLPGGRTLRLLELRVVPRRAEFRLMSGSLWFDEETFGLVRAVFRPARPFDIELDGDSDDVRDVPAVLRPVRAEVRYVTLEYGLYDLRWWMPRYVAVDAEAQFSAVRMPLRFERIYEGYRVEGGSPPPLGSTFRPAGTVRRRARGDTLASRADSIRADSLRRAVRECRDRARSDPEVQRLERRERDRAIRVRVRVCARRDESDSALAIVVPEDGAALLANPQLGPPILDMGDVVSEGELRQLAREIGAIPERPWQFHAFLPSGVGSVLRHARYNRIEALSLGVGSTLDFGRLAADGLVRIGVADLEPNVEIGLARPARTARFRLGLYRRLAAANAETRPFALINSLSAVLAQRDDGEYFRTLGGEVSATDAGSGWWSWRVFGERQRLAMVETQASLPHIFDDSSRFRPNIAADRADEAGASLTVRAWTTLSRTVRLGAEATVDGATGTFDYGRGALTLRGTLTPAGPLALALEAAAGTSSGALPVQADWFLGGPATLRGYDGAVRRGPAFWRGRAEIGNSLPAVRLALFSDVGWAGPRRDFASGRPLLGVGAGASVLDGIVRLDLARGLRAPRGWRLDVYLDALF